MPLPMIDLEVEDSYMDFVLHTEEDIDIHRPNTGAVQMEDNGENLRELNDEFELPPLPRVRGRSQAFTSSALPVEDRVSIQDSEDNDGAAALVTDFSPDGGPRFTPDQTSFQASVPKEKHGQKNQPKNTHTVACQQAQNVTELDDLNPDEFFAGAATLPGDKSERPRASNRKTCEGKAVVVCNCGEVKLYRNDRNIYICPACGHIVSR